MWSCWHCLRQSYDVRARHKSFPTFPHSPSSSPLSYLNPHRLRLLALPNSDPLPLKGNERRKRTLLRFLRPEFLQNILFCRHSTSYSSPSGERREREGRDRRDRGLEFRQKQGNFSRLGKREREREDEAFSSTVEKTVPSLLCRTEKKRRETGEKRREGQTRYQ